MPMLSPHTISESQREIQRNKQINQSNFRTCVPAMKHRKISKHPHFRHRPRWAVVHELPHELRVALVLWLVRSCTPGCIVDTIVETQVYLTHEPVNELELTLVIIFYLCLKRLIHSDRLLNNICYHYHYHRNSNV